MRAATFPLPAGRRILADPDGMLLDQAPSDEAIAAIPAFPGLDPTVLSNALGRGELVFYLHRNDRPIAVVTLVPSVVGAYQAGTTWYAPHPETVDDLAAVVERVVQEQAVNLRRWLLPGGCAASLVGARPAGTDAHSPLPGAVRLLFHLTNPQGVVLGSVPVYLQGNQLRLGPVALLGGPDTHDDLTPLIQAVFSNVQSARTRRS